MNLHGLSLTVFATTPRKNVRRWIGGRAPEYIRDDEHLLCGGIYVNAPCEIDGNLISGRTYHDSGDFVGPWIRLLEGAREIAAA